MMTISEDIWDQVNRLNAWKEGFFTKDKVKNSLRSFTFNYLDLDLKQYFIDRKKIRVLSAMTKNLSILKPDKGNGMVVLQRSDYVNSVTSLYTNSSRFKQLSSDPTSSRLSSLQQYLHSLLKHGEISEADQNRLRPKAATFGRAYGLPKTRKSFNLIPSFRPIIDTTNTPHYNVGKFLSTLLNPITVNKFSLKDSFDTASAIQSIPQNLFNEGYPLVSFDVESLFTNVPLKQTINIIIRRAYNEKLLDTTLTKRSLEKLLTDSCTKTAFSFDNNFSEQVDGVSMGSPLGPVLANIILTEFENVVVSDLLQSSILKFYRRYVDDILVLVKPTDIPTVLNKFNAFDKNLNPTVENFKDGSVQFLDLNVTDKGIAIFRKDTHTGQYTHFSRFEPWGRKTAWIKSLFYRAVMICSEQFLLNNQITNITQFMSWNGFPANIKKSIISKLK